MESCPMGTQKQKNIKENVTTEASAQSDQKDLDTCKQALSEWQGKYSRLSADFENYKKRLSKEQATWTATVQASMLNQLLSIVDNFDRAMAHKAEQSTDMQSWIDGVAMIHDEFHEFLKNAGVKEVPYKIFNPEYHEALLQVDSDTHESGQIIEVMEKGYLLEDKVLRPARVSVAK